MRQSEVELSLERSELQLGVCSGSVEGPGKWVSEAASMNK